MHGQRSRGRSSRGPARGGAGRNAKPPAGRASGGAARRRRAPRVERKEEIDDSLDQRVIIPEDQIKLTEKEMQEQIPRVLTANDPNVATNLVYYSFAENAHKGVPGSAESEHVHFHFALDGTLVAKESEEGEKQLAAVRETRKKMADREKELEREARQQGKDVEELREEVGDAGGRNQFNYSERAAQTYNPPMKSRGVATRPPDSAVFSGCVSRWDIYDAYMGEFERLVAKEEEEASKGKRGAAAAKSHAHKPKARTGEAVVHGDACGWSLRVMERMVCQNQWDDYYSDLKYWDDESDPLKPGGMGTLLPLWKFTEERALRSKMVTAIKWNPRYPDMFAVAYGSYDFMKQGSGLVCVYTLKNVRYPEYLFTLESGAVSIDWHPTRPALLAVGCYDGTTKVFDVRKKENKPLYAADVRSGKHTDPVWGVRWMPDAGGAELGFMSVSSDGKVAGWVLSKNDLQMEPVMSLKLVQTAAASSGSGSGGGAGGSGAGGGPMVVAEDESSLSGLAGGCCFDFNPFNENIFLVGTEEGRIHKCSRAYSGQYLETYEGHHMVVYNVQWSPFHERVFLSCSADWTVKIWDHLCPRAVMSFDLQNAVGDACWSPFSSTVLGAVTANGKGVVFDLAVNKHEQLCDQKLVKKAQLTHVSFATPATAGQGTIGEIAAEEITDPAAANEAANDQTWMLLTGDSKGWVRSYKLSPNLRKVTPIPVPEVKKGQVPPPPPTRLEVEVAKLNKIMAAADVKASVPITAWDGSLGRKAKAAEGEGGAASGAGD